jgi:small subunit ribosomal protein S3
MGQKVHPTGFRVGITEDWRSRWFADKQRFGKLLVQDQHIRRFIKKEYEFAGIPKIEIERDMERVHIILHTSRPGLIIGKKGAKVDKLKEDLERMCQQEVKLEIREVTNPETNAQLTAEAVAQQLVRRAAFRRVMKMAIKGALDKGALGVKLQVAGRLGGSEMARCEIAAEGKIPLQTLQANVEYGFAEAFTTYGAIGVKCWIYHGPYKEEESFSHGSHAKKG